MSDDQEGQAVFTAGYTIDGALFDLGDVCCTQEITRLLDHESILGLLARHSRGDWGTVSGGDADDNRSAVGTEARVVSEYHTPSGGVLVITESDRSRTTILFTDEY